MGVVGVRRTENDGSHLATIKLLCVYMSALMDNLYVHIHTHIHMHTYTYIHTYAHRVQDYPSCPVSIGLTSDTTSSILPVPPAQCRSSSLNHLHGSAANSRPLSPCPSFNSLNHSNIHSVLPPLSSNSRRSV